MHTKVRFVEVTNEVLASKPADGTYAVISYDESREMTRYSFAIDRVFPWRTHIYVFKDSFCKLISSYTDAGDALSKYEVDLVYLVDVPAYKRAELDKQLAQHGFELEPELATA